MADPEVPAEELDPSLGELEFMRLLPRLLPFALHETLSDFQLEVRIGQRFRVDALTFASDGTPIIVEAKVVTPQTSRRLRDAQNQLEMYRRRLHRRAPWLTAEDGTGGHVGPASALQGRASTGCDRGR